MFSPVGAVGLLVWLPCLAAPVASVRLGYLPAHQHQREVHRAETPASIIASLHFTRAKQPAYFTGRGLVRTSKVFTISNIIVRGIDRRYMPAIAPTAWAWYD